MSLRPLPLIGILVAGLPLQAAPLRDVPVEVTTPDGRVLHLRATGDEFFRLVMDRDGFTVVRDPDSGEVVYADLRDGDLAPTPWRVGRDDPRLAGLHPGVRPSVARFREARQAWTSWLPRPRRSAPNRGTLNNLVLFVRFADEAPLTSRTATWEAMLNGTPEVRNSLRDYYLEASYGALTVQSHLLPRPTGETILTYQDIHPRSFYQKYQATTNPGGYRDAGEAMVREQQMVRRALEATIHDLPPGIDLDGDDDGFVDNLAVVISGQPDGWSDLLWPHMTLQLADLIYLDDDLIVLTYNLQLHDMLADGSRVGVLAHELFHTLGAPDLYHYSDDGMTPAGPWDLMEWDLPIPQHMSLHMKVRWGRWVPDPPMITESGTYLVRPLTASEGQGWRLPIPGEPKQHFLVEYRRRTGPFEASLPDEGLLIWRVDERWWGNPDGPPDELYVFRPGGSPSQDGKVRQAPFSAQNGRTSFDPGTDPFPFSQYGTPVGLRITDITAAGGDVMGFTVCMAYQTCFLNRCGDDGCGGSCGECPWQAVCEDGQCRDRQRCDTYAACLAACPEDDEACQAQCGRVPAVCPEPGPCREAGTCDPATGQCRYDLLPEGSPCQDGDPCTRDDACDDQGTCRGLPDPACAVPDTNPEEAPDAVDTVPEPADHASAEETLSEAEDLATGTDSTVPGPDVPASWDPTSREAEDGTPPESPDGDAGTDASRPGGIGGGGCTAGNAAPGPLVLVGWLLAGWVARGRYRWWQGRSRP
ncbi:MAG TPA: hypothetical protein PLQ97_09260 [Myxococcota bacterium]|nr:hypothetical protein [Myxococcota bacterium]HQK50966.1 hypothetical protein [Myxococcota bacterium]